MKARRYLVVLDVDGTLLEGTGRMTVSVRDVLQLARQAGHQLTIVTGRGLPRLLDAIGGLEEVFPPTTLVGVEQGSRVLALSGFGQVFHDPVPLEKVDRFVVNLTLDELSFVAFHPHDSALWSKIWSPHPDVRTGLSTKLSRATLIQGTKLDHLLAEVRDSRPSMVVARMRGPATPELQSVSGATWAGGSNLTLVRDPFTKGRALERLMQEYRTTRQLTFVVGDEEPDASMLALVAAENRVIVGQALIGTRVDDLKARHVRSPLELGPTLRDALDQ
jgi:hydroxymethylpyrimidine pyrophosphatase-like HAD family hydrolase